MTTKTSIPLSRSAQLDPLTLSEIVFALRMKIEAGTNLKIRTGRDWAWFKQTRIKLRGTPPSPYFDPDVTNPYELADNSFWMVLEQNGEVVFLDAYRLIDVQDDFRTWLIGWLMSSHILAGDNAIITAPPKLPQSGADQLHGPLAYRGEVWMASDIATPKPKQLSTKLSLLSMALCWMEYKPNAIWGLTALNNLRDGKMSRVGHSTAERDYIKWKKKPDCVAHKNETLVYSTASQIVDQLWNARPIS